MILREMIKAGLTVEEQRSGSKVEYVVQLRKPKKCSECSGTIQSRGYKNSRTVYDLIEDNRIEERTIWMPRYTCSKCKRNLYDEDKATYDKILPPRIILTEDAKTFLIRKQLHNPEYSYSQIADEYKLGKPLVSAMFKSFLVDVRQKLSAWMKCDRIIMIPFNWREESNYCLFALDQATNELGVFDILPPDQLVNMLVLFSRHNIDPNSIVCPFDKYLIDDIPSVYDGEVFFLKNSFDTYLQYIQDHTNATFVQKLFDIAADSNSIEDKISIAREHLDKISASFPEALLDDIRVYLLGRNHEIDISHNGYIEKTIAEIKSMRSRGITYDSIALQFIFSLPQAREALKKADLSKYIV